MLFVIVLVQVWAMATLQATLTLYDAAITEDEANAGLLPVAKLTISATFDGSNSQAFDFGVNSGAVTIEFVVEGDPVVGGNDGFLAVGANSTSSIRYEQWNDTGQLGFTQGGVADYLFSPLVLSPTEPTHVAYRWDGDGRMDLFMDGTLIGQSSSVSGAFAMPSGSGFLGNNAVGSEGMVGTIHRVTVYDEALDAVTVARHADAFQGITHPPLITAFAADPDAYLAPGSTTLTWDVSGADTISIGGTDVTGQNQLLVSPAVTTTYTLTAGNSDGPVTEELTVTVDPQPVIDRFSADRIIINAGEPVTLTWETEFATDWSISPTPGDVAGETSGGVGAVVVRPSNSMTYTLTVGSGFGTTMAEVVVDVAMVATHLVISEFMADNETVLADGDGTYPDWIEIFNPTGAAIQLAGYYLTDDPLDLTKWMFPNHLLGPGERVIVFASLKHLNPPVDEMHANFRLSKSGEYLALVAPDGLTPVHAYFPAFPPQANDISYGILGGDLGREQFMGTPTPGALNDATLPAPRAVVFSAPSQTFTASLGVALSSVSSGATIYYTTDGSVPSSGNGTLYAAPLSVVSTTHLRARAELAGQSGPVSGQSYIKLAADLAAYQADLPLMIIDNFGAGTIPAKGWSGTGSGVRQVARQSAVWATFERDPVTGLAALGDQPQMISRIGIRGRGAFSSSWLQKPYSVETWDEAADERDVEVLGMPKHADWILYYPDINANKDPSMMFNTFMYELSRDMGRYATRFRWVEAFVNEDGGDLSLSDRRGVYAIMEKVSRGAGRLDFDRLSPDGSTGGFLLGLNRMDSIPEGGWPAVNGVSQPQFFHTKGADRVSQTSPNSSGGGDDIPRQSNGYLNFDNPGGYKINPAQRAAVEGWFDTFEDVLYNNNQWLDPVNGYRKYLDAEDFVDYFMFNNLSRNGDGMLISMFPWVGDDGKLRMGPAWDYNWSSYFVSGAPTGTLWHRRNRIWYGRLFTDPDFEQLYIDRWFGHRAGPMSNASIEAIVDGQAAEIGLERALRQGYASQSAWNAQLTSFKDWITTRADWYDNQFTEPPAFTVPGGNVPDGFVVTFSPPPGTIYYTSDGSDPRASGGAVAAGAQQYEGGVILSTVVGDGAPVRVIVPTATTPPAGLGWTLDGFNDSMWVPGITGVGYDRNVTYDQEIKLNLDATMDGVNTSAYLRIEFEMADPSIYDVLVLKMKYDDGFIAYLNGVRVAAANDPMGPVWNSDADGTHDDGDALQFVNFSINSHVSDLVAGTNVLAIHGLNDSIASSDFLMVPVLEVGQSTVATGLELHGSTLITARTRVGTDWSAPTSAMFFVGTTAPDQSNLVVSELHYRPTDASLPEMMAGFTDRDDFEFVELMNTGVQELNMSGVRFSLVGGMGIEFDFTTSSKPTLGPGERVLLVQNRSAFEERYGTGLAGQIAGEFTGNLSNDGELVTLIDVNSAVIHAFTYNDQAPWPEGPDGDGFSLVLIDPAQSPSPDHADPFSWRASHVAGGSPGSSDGDTYADWKVVHGVPTPEIDLDLDRDGRDNFMEYVMGASPSIADSGPEVVVSVEPVNVDGVIDSYVVFRFERNLVADDVLIRGEVSSDLVTWEHGPPAVVFLGRERTGPDHETLLFRLADPGMGSVRKFVRIWAELR